MESGTIVRWLSLGGRQGREGPAALRARHRQGHPGGRGRRRRRAAEDRRPGGRGARRDGGRRRSARRARTCPRGNGSEAPQSRAAAQASEREPEREGRQAAAEARERRGASAAAAPETAGGSRPRRSRGGSRASAGIDLAALPGPGPEGRIVAEDVERAPRRRRRRTRRRRRGAAARSSGSRSPRCARPSRGG